MAVRYLTSLVATIVLVGCVGSAAGSPAPSPLDLRAVTAVLGNAGIQVVDAADNPNVRDRAWRCMPGSFRLARVSQQPAAAFARPGDRPSVDILVFSSDAKRSVAQAAIGADGQVQAQGCGVIVEWVATPHAVGTRNVPLIGTDTAGSVRTPAAVNGTAMAMTIARTLCSVGRMSGLRCV